ncbi:MAG TPA: MATE family efflux transporter [Polyangiaceae bacterium]|nr:MATE family efflux transporter [Polyangiaceae bacterium]
MPAKKLTLWSLSWPLFVEQGLRISIGTVDTLMVSHVSDNAVAALGVAWQVVILALIVFNFIGIGSSVVITHHLGAGDRAGADRLSRAALGVNSWLGLGMSVFIASQSRHLLELLHLPAALFEYAVPFLTLLGGSLFLDAQSIALSASLRAHGHTRPVMLVTGAQNALNALGNALLLFGLFGLPKLGVTGVALSSVVSRALGLLVLQWAVRRETGLRISLADYLRLPGAEVRRMLRIGLPAAGENLCYWLALMVVTTFNARLGEASLAAATYAMQIMAWVIVFANSIGMGTEILIGHRIGDGDLERAYRELLRSLRIGVLIAIGTSASMALAAPLVARAFTSDALTASLIIGVLRIGMLLEPGRVVNIVVINALRATGDARFPLLMAVASMWGVWVPLAWLLGVRSGLGVAGVWLAMCCDEWLRGIIMYRRWTRRGWLRHAEQSRQALAAGLTRATEPPS